ncbi:MAG: PilZ domain-containing protein [Alkalispirochaetaceae bacterium]
MYLFLAIVGALILILILAQLRKPKPKKRVIKTTPVLKRRPPETHFREELVLSPRESRALERLSWCLKDPKNKDQLLENQALFLRAARRALREGMVTEAELFRLTERMGVNLNTLRANRHSSTSVPVGAEASVADRKMHMATGEVLLSDDQTLRVKIQKGHSSFNRGIQVELVCNGEEGMYRFFTTVKAQEGKVLALEHSNHVEHVQRRKYRRRRVQIPVELSLRAINDRALPSKTVDLSAGGAAVRNPKKRYVTGSELDITLSTPSGSPMVLPATVVRTSKRNKILHLRFGKLDDRQQHRLFRILFTIGNK